MISTGRRGLLTALTAIACSGWGTASLAQSKKPPVLIGWLNTGSRKDHPGLAAFKEGMSALGWKEGVDYSLEERWSDGRNERIHTLAGEIGARKPAVIVAATASATQAAVKASPATPIVQASGTSPVDRGLAKSLPRPGGTVTGLTNLSNDVAEKYLELLLDAVSGIRRVGFLIDTSIPALRDAAMKAARRSADQFRIDGRFGEIAQPAEIERAITDLAKDGAQALIPMPGLFLTAHSHRIVTTAQAHRLPVVGGVGFLQAGALVTYGAQSAALYRRAAYFVDRILKGAKPADLPIEQPATFELVVNVKTARSLGLALPRELLVRADRIIE